MIQTRHHATPSVRPHAEACSTGRHAPCRVVLPARRVTANGPRLNAALESVHAGFPSVAQDYMVADFSLDDHVIPHPETTFIVSVTGDSMQDAGIWDGDLLIVDRGLDPESGDVVIAALDGELTVKRLLVNGGGVLLHPENPLYDDIIVGEPQDLVIWGVVTGSYHHLLPSGSTGR